MSDKPEPSVPKAPEPENEELSQDEREQVSGGLNIDGIKGESTDDKHKDWIEIF